MPDSSTISIWIPLASTIVGGLIALSGTYLMDFLKDKKETKAFNNTQKIYHKLLIQEFEKTLWILNCNDWYENPLKAIDYKFFKQNRFEFSKYIPVEIYEYGEFLKQCEILMYSINDYESIDEVKIALKKIITQGSTRLEFLNTL